MRLVIDTESDGLYAEATKLWCMVMYDPDKDTTDTYDVYNDNIQQGIEKLLQADEIICHNFLGHDGPLIERLHGVRFTNKITDTYVLSRLLNPDRERPYNMQGRGGPHGLDAWGYRVGRGKPSHDDWSQYSEDMLHRCTEDTHINWLMYQILLQEMAGHNWEMAIEVEHEVQRIIFEQEQRGVPFDIKLADSLMSELSQEIIKAESTILELVHDKPKHKGVTISEPYTKTGNLRKSVSDWYEHELTGCHDLIGGPFDRIEWTTFNPNSNNQVKELLFSLGWQPDEWNYKDGEKTSPKITESSFGSIRGEGVGEAIKRRVLVTHRRNQLKGWIERVRPDETIAAGANTIGTPTFRFRHFGVVNVPKAKEKIYMGIPFRSLFHVPDPDYMMVGHDADQLELRMLAHYMNDEEYIKLFIEGLDIHAYNQRLAELPDRDAAKSFIYAFNYGAGDEKLGVLIGGDVEAGRSARRRFLKANPSLERLLKNVKRASAKGWLKGLDGRKIRMRQQDGKVMTHKALNTLLQAAGSVVMKHSMVWLDQQVKLHGLRAYKLLDMHDEGQAMVHKEDIKKYSELAEQSIVKAGELLKLRLPLGAEVKVGHNWAETH